MQGGWETDETVNGAAARETLEEAGVRGIIEVSPCTKKARRRHCSSFEHFSKRWLTEDWDEEPI